MNERDVAQKDTAARLFFDVFRILKRRVAPWFGEPYHNHKLRDLIGNALDCGVKREWIVEQARLAGSWNKLQDVMCQEIIRRRQP